MKTGLTVDFCNRKILREEEGAIPLFAAYKTGKSRISYTERE